MANSQFDLSLLSPIDEKNNNFESQLTPMDKEEEDMGTYLDNLPKGEGFFNKLPRNILIGLSKLGHSTLNLPHDLAYLAENRLSELSNKIEKGSILKNSPKYNNVKLSEYNNLKLSDYIPKQTDYDFASMLGQKGDPTLMDKLIQGGIEYFPEIAGGAGLARAGVRRLKGTHQLDAVEKAAKQYGGNNFSYSPQVAKEARKYLPNTEATKQIFTKSMGGDYPASFAMRSQLGKHQRDLANSPLAAERLLAPEISDLRQRMLGQLDQALRGQGMHVEADMLRTGTRNYAQYMRVKKAVMPVIKKLGIPTSIAAAVGFGYQKGKKLVKD